nr:lipoprotein [Streptomyces tsukubensis NRRL18488]
MTKGTVRIGRDKECRAEMTTGRGGTVDVIRTRDGAAYLRLSEAQIRSRPGSRTPAQVDADVRLFSDQWLKGDPSAPQVRQTLQLCDIRNMIPKLPATAVEAPGTVTADGRRVVFTARDQEETLTVHIGPGRNPTLHKMERTGGESPFTAVFSGYGEPVGATHPAAEDVLTQNEVRSLFRDTDSAPARDGNR